MNSEVFLSGWELLPALCEHWGLFPTSPQKSFFPWPGVLASPALISSHQRLAGGRGQGVETLSKYLRFFVSDSPCLFSALMPLMPGLQLCFLNSGRRSGSGSPSPQHGPETALVSGQLRAHPACFLSLVIADGHDPVHCFQCPQVIWFVNVSIVPGRRVNLVCIRPPWLEAEVESSLWFQFPFCNYWKG